MKNLMKIFMALVVALVAFSCVTDTTEDLGANVGAVGQTEITLSLEESRTQLGEKAGDLYPVFWSEGDKISVNGVESNAAAIASNRAVATFSVSGVVETPYCIAYPAAPAGQVLFAEKQAHTNNTTFASGVTTMYGYSEEGFGIAMKHLTGILKIGIVGNAKLAMAQISTADRAPIAGAFAIDYTTGEVTPTADSKPFVEYSFGEGLQLTSETSYLHLAVPAGVYDELYVTLYDVDGGVMYATVKASDENPLKAGKLREFSNHISYVPTASLFVIKDKATLLEFAAQAATLEHDALFVADVDMTGEAWTPIQGYSKTVNGNGYAIKGLTAPLFGTTSASIKGLHLQNVVLQSNDADAIAGLACKVLATDSNTPVIEHCSVSGTLTVDNKNYSPTVAKSLDALTYGGVVGYVSGVNINGCVSNVKIDVVQSINSACTVESILHLGGIVGRVGIYTNTVTNEVVYSNITNCTNNGAISSTDATNPKCVFRCGGILGISDDTNIIPAKIDNCTNNAPITFKEVNFSGTLTMMIGGIVSYSTKLGVYNCTNTKNGKINIVGNSSNLYTAGIAAYSFNIDCKNTTNYGDVETEGTIVSNLMVAGMLASPGYADSTGERYFYADNLVNYGNVDVKMAAGSARIGGVFGRGSQGDVSNSVNHGNVTLAPNGGDLALTIALGGFEGEGTGDSDAGTFTECVNNGIVTLDLTGCNNVTATRVAAFSGYNHHFFSKCTNNGNVVVKGTATFTTNNVLDDKTTDSHYNIGGLTGYKAAANGHIDESVNNGNVIFEATVTSPEGKSPCIQIGGLVGRTHQLIYDTNTQNGKIIVRGDLSASTAVLCVGGTAGIIHGVDKSGFTNAGDIHITGKYGKMYVGGNVGLNNAYDLAALTNSTNSGNIYIGVNEEGEAVATTLTNGPYIGGNIGRTDRFFNNLTNSGNIYMKAIVTYADPAAEDAENTYLAGCVALANTADLGDACHTLENSGNITFEGDYGAKILNIGGCTGYMYGNADTNHSFHNSGDITYNGTPFKVGIDNHMRLGGISCYLQCTIRDMTNDGNITVSGSVGHSMYVGGVFANPNGYNRTRLVNNGDITLNGTVNKDCFIGGISYELKAGNKKTWLNCVNNGNITTNKNALVKGTLSIAGIIAKASTKDENKIFQGCENNGNISSYGKSTGTVLLGGLIGYVSNGVGIVVKDGFVNNGTITYGGTTDGADAVYVGGVLGYAYTFGYDTTTWTGKVINNGNIIASGVSIGGQYNVGGIFAAYLGDVGEAVELYNFGNITVTGSGGTKNGVEGIEKIGGIAGRNDGFTLRNATSYCNIDAKTANYVGFICGEPRSDTVIAQNCKLGGQLIGEYNIEDETYKTTTLDNSNFFDYIYGGTTDWAGVDGYDGCGVLTEKPTIPTAPVE